MSVRISSDRELTELCAKTLAVHSTPGRDGIPGVTIAGLFHAVRIAQCAAYAASYREAVNLRAVKFPTTAPGSTMLGRPDLKALYEELRLLEYNTVDRDGNEWLPRDMARLLNHLRTRTAAKAAGF